MENKESNNIKDSLFDILASTNDQHIIAQKLKENDISIDDLKVIYDLAEQFYNNYEFKEAELIFGVYSILNPYDPRGAGGLAAIYIQIKDYKKALHVLNVLKTNPLCDIDETFLNITLCHYKLKELSTAASIFQLIQTGKFNSFYMKRYEYLKKQLNKYI